MCEGLNRVVVFLILNIFTNVLVLATGNQVKGSASQSSQYRTCSAKKAFDGEIIFHESESRCTCSATASHQIPRWWEMNFGSKHLIGSIKVIGRDGRHPKPRSTLWKDGDSHLLFKGPAREQSQSLAVYISNDTMGTNSGTVVHMPDSNTIGLIVQFNHAPRVAQYINIKKDVAKDVMTICEVEVFGATCHSGFYDDCKQVCGKCKQPPCNKTDGYCTGGCAEGFAGDKCDEDYKEERLFTASEVAGVAGGSVGGCLLLLGLVFASLLVYRRYKSASKERDTTNVIPDIEYVNTRRAYGGPYELQLQNRDEHIYQTIKY
ncbi:uncharacterized protein LOC128227214 isoform X3 [Mya arenaria]|uniref:uncharacterized protein LOC128227214 isoform X3 n=1 Tax=Mya arenaria TaxID=6604 RepID=UPI0022E008B0|nr:uncharacterized protein LOC128227214 isoform X3 [Mya arenaria]